MFPNKQKAFLVLFALAAVVLAGCEADRTPETYEAIVNGEGITQAQVEQTRAALEQQVGFSVSFEDALEHEIVTLLLFQEAERRGVSVSAQEAENKFEGELAQQNISLGDVSRQLPQHEYEALIIGLQEQYTLEALARNQEDVSVSEEQARQWYGVNAAMFSGPDGEELLFEEVSDMIREGLEQQRISEVLNDLAQRLRAEAEITR
jgi:hypothetical protein